MKKYTPFVAVCALFFFSSPGRTAGFTMNPGQWEFTTTMTMPMLPQPQTTTSSECISKEEAQKDPLADLVDSGNCAILNKKISGNTLHFTMKCTNDGMVTEGSGTFTGQKNTASGSVVMTMNMPQMANMPNMPSGPMTMTTRWQGKRTGNCK